MCPLFVGGGHDLDVFHNIKLFVENGGMSITMDPVVSKKECF